MGIPIIGGLISWIFNQVVLFALFAMIFFGLKYLLTSILSATTEKIDNFILKIIAKFTLPSIVGLILAYLAYLVNCKALAEFVLVMGIAIGGPVTWGVLLFLQPILNFSILNSLWPLFAMLIVISVIEIVLPIFLPGIGKLIALLLTLIELIIMYFYIGNDTRGMINCFMNLVGHKAIPGTGGISIGS